MEVSSERFEAVRNFIASSVRSYQQSKQAEESNSPLGQFSYVNAIGAMVTVGLLFGQETVEALKAWLAEQGTPYPTELPRALQDIVDKKQEALDFFTTYRAPPIDPPDRG